jgi:peptide deformylase
MILDDMLDTMYENEGVGLAGPQIGILKRLVVIDVDGENVYKMVNPKILSTSGSQIDDEGCLSVPKRRGNVDRPQFVTVAYTDEYGNSKTLKGEGFLARCICHELDHLEGVLFIDKVLEEQVD